MRNQIKNLVKSNRWIMETWPSQIYHFCSSLSRVSSMASTFADSNSRVQPLTTTWFSNASRVSIYLLNDTLKKWWQKMQSRMNTKSTIPLLHLRASSTHDFFCFSSVFFFLSSNQDMQYRYQWKKISTKFYKLFKSAEPLLFGSQIKRTPESFAILSLNFSFSSWYIVYQRLEIQIIKK